MLNRSEFEVLYACMQGHASTQRCIAEASGLSLGSVNKAVKSLAKAGLVDAELALTDAGRVALDAYRVDSAIILAAGAGTRFAPLSFERPKALFEVRGEVLIERLIRQLRQAGIERICVVTGYMKESLFYLEDEFGVAITVNPEYATRNNHSSVWCARRHLGSSYIISSDQSFADGLFCSHCFAPFCTASRHEGRTDGLTLKLGSHGRVRSIARGGNDALRMRGPVYLDADSSRILLNALERDYDLPETRGKLWDEVMADHLTELSLYANEVPESAVTEFDFLTDLVAFDSDFFANVDSGILDNICATLNCTRDEISEVQPVKAGLTNLSTLFSARGEKFIYRHPGTGTNELINRRAETFALEVAKELGLDDTFIYEDPDEGWKISRYIEGCSELDYEDELQVRRALALTRRLHESGRKSPYSFDFWDEAEKIVGLLKDMRYGLPRDFNSLAETIAGVAAKMRAEAGEPVLCHNDLYGPNFLVRGEEMRLIDWEYAAMGDPACDLGNFVAQGSGYSVEQTLGILPLYYGRPVTPEEERHCLAAVAVVGWYWYVWAMYKEAMGNPVGEWLYVWYRAAKRFAAAAEQRYAAAE